jgi:hypothetical protein
VEEKRAPDPFRPGSIDEGRPYAKAGRPITPVLVVTLIVVVALALVLYAVLR